jgi:hypothetical protein
MSPVFEKTENQAACRNPRTGRGAVPLTMYATRLPSTTSLYASREPRTQDRKEIDRFSEQTIALASGCGLRILSSVCCSE